MCGHSFWRTVILYHPITYQHQYDRHTSPVYLPPWEVRLVYDKGIIPVRPVIIGPYNLCKRDYKYC